jgi:4'-phosphopantetheinyl transferase
LQLPEREQKKVTAFRRWEDATASLIGKALLLQGLSVTGYQQLKLDDLQYSRHNRPFLTGGIDFNIAHSGGYVVCAIAGHCRIGFDIEQIQKQDLNSFKYTLNPAEAENVLASASPYELFYDTWTKKEAITKADGRGLGLNLSRIDTTAGPVVLDGEVWYTQRVDISAGYAANIAFNNSSSVLKHTIVRI